MEKGMNSQLSDRRSYLGGSDARTVLGKDEAALLRLWHEKRGEIEPEDLSGNLVVQFGCATEELNRRWFMRETGHSETGEPPKVFGVGAVQRFVRHPKLDWMGATARRNSARRWRGVRGEVHAALEF